MATSAATIDHILEAVAEAGDVTARRMFGEYALYLSGRVVALVCDDLLHVKPTEGARALLPDAPMALPYPGARPHLLVTDALDDADLMARLLRAVAADLPPPKPKKPKTPKRPNP